MIRADSVGKPSAYAVTTSDPALASLTVITFSEDSPANLTKVGNLSSAVNRELSEATSELDMIKALTPGLATTAPTTAAPASAPMDTSEKKEDGKEERQDDRTTRPRQDEGERDNQEDKNSKQDMAKLKQRVDMLTTLVLRQEHQLMINRQDASYIIFIRTDIAPSLAVTTYEVGQKWKQAKATKPDSLKHPLRVILFQHLPTSMTSALGNLVADTEKLENAKKLGWIKDGHFTGMKWNPDKKAHELDESIPLIPIQGAMEVLFEAVKLSVEPFAVNRYHAMRPLSSQYSSPTLTMFLEVGLRTAEANRLWSIFNNLSQTSVWVFVGAYCRHERLQRSALANRLAQSSNN